MVIFDIEKEYLGPYDIETLHGHDVITLDFVSPDNFPIHICLTRTFKDEAAPNMCGNDDPPTDRWVVTHTASEELSDMEALGLSSAMAVLQKACVGQKRMRAALADAINKLRSLGFALPDTDS